MASSDAARKAWETRRRLAAGRDSAAGSEPMRVAQFKTASKPAQNGGSVDFNMSKRGSVFATPYRVVGKKEITNCDLASPIDGIRLDSSLYKGYHRRDPIGHGRWTIVISGPHKTGIGLAKLTHGPIESDFLDLLRTCVKLADAQGITKPTVRVMP